MQNSMALANAASVPNGFAAVSGAPQATVRPAANAGFAAALAQMAGLFPNGTQDAVTGSASLLNALARIGAPSADASEQALDAFREWLDAGAEFPDEWLQDPAWLELLAEIQLALSASAAIPTPAAGEAPLPTGTAEAGSENGEVPGGIRATNGVAASELLIRLFDAWRTQPGQPELNRLMLRLHDLANRAPEGSVRTLASDWIRAAVSPSAPNPPVSVERQEKPGNPGDQGADRPEALIEACGEIRKTAIARLEWLAAKASGVRFAVEGLAGTAYAGSATDPGTTGETAKPEPVVGPQAFFPSVRPDSAAQVLPAERPSFISAREFAAEMAEWMANRWKVTLNGQVQETRITLSPEHLGQVDVKLGLNHGQLVAQLVAETPHAKELIESQLAALRTALSVQGIQVEKLEVVQAGALSSGMFQERRDHQPSPHGGQSGNPGSRSHAEDTEDATYQQIAQVSAEYPSATALSTFEASA